MKSITTGLMLSASFFISAMQHSPQLSSLTAVAAAELNMNEKELSYLSRAMRAIAPIKQSTSCFFQGYILPTKSTFTRKDFAGKIPECIDERIAWIKAGKLPTLYSQRLIIIGESGMSKTALVQVMAGETNSDLYYLSERSLATWDKETKYRIIEKIFEVAHAAHRPAIICIDNITGKDDISDAIYSFATRHESKDNNFVSVICIAKDRSVFSSRFWYKTVILEAPETKNRRAILTHYLQKTDTTFNIKRDFSEITKLVDRIISKTKGFSHRELLLLIFKATRLAITDNINQIFHEPLIMIKQDHLENSLKNFQALRETLRKPKMH